MSVQRLQPAVDGSGDLILVDSAWEDSSGLDFAVSPGAGVDPLPGINPIACSASNHAQLDSLQSDLALALGSSDAAQSTAVQIVSDAELRIDTALGVATS